MADITAAMVKDLRERTGAGMMDCKKALAETDGDTEAAVDWLRTKGLAAAAKKAGRVAAEGLIGMAGDGKVAALVEVNSETDFVARNDGFQAFVKGVAQVALAENGDFAAVQAADYPGEQRTVDEQVTQMVGTIGENIQFRRCVGLTVSEGVVATYMHNAVSPGLGKIGVIVGLESAAETAGLEALGKQLAMHVAAAAPQAVEVAGLDPAVVEHERNVLSEQARESGKPEEVVAKMVEGRLRKFYAESVLLEQVFVIDGETKVANVVEQAAADLGSKIKVSGFCRFALGEGIEKRSEDFAAEVAAAQGG
ncbi:MAG: translation elongation factor Ts [Alphaproteobacteria bacterium]|jgi:elongation factor Ts|nr:elongation factor Ts [Rhodospirillaceae bacterium]MDP6407264.1 translation elongation factor Ts [Alphaproteobacteria bacterium]MDP6621608.1 translation elongation factor Ts [Alphaproteobacteria bacterium]|tara:strand:+ start:2403 stop:3329 length:927 start_codon:yes stop_codon:yes gene_type:complete